jgi:hypothetical protein
MVQDETVVKTLADKETKLEGRPVLKKLVKLFLL